MAKEAQSRNRGSIVERGRGKWSVRVFLGVDPAGKRKYLSETVRGTRKDAERHLTKKLRELDTGTLVEPSRLTLRAFLARWLETKTDVTERTRLSYEDRLEKDVYPGLGERRLEHLAPLDLQQCVAELTGRGLSPRTVQYTFTVLNQALRQAVVWGLLGRNPMEGVTLPRRVRAEMKVLTPAQVSLFLERTGAWWRAGDWRGRYHPLWTLLLTSGLRPGEALGLKWEDLDSPYLNVRRALSRIRGNKKLGYRNHWVIKDPKTEKSRRRIRLDGTTLGILEEHRRDQLKGLLAAGTAGQWVGWIFSSRTGGYFDQEQIRTAWKRDLVNCGLPGVRLYDARHTHATTLLIRKVNPRVAADRLGHSNVSITLDIYSHVLPEIEEQTASEVEQAFFRQAAG